MTPNDKNAVNKVHEIAEKFAHKQQDLAEKSIMSGEDISAHYGVITNSAGKTVSLGAGENSKEKKKEREREMQRMAAEAIRAAIEGFDKAFDNADKLLANMSLKLDHIKKDIDRAEYLMQEILRANELLENGAENDFREFMREHGASESEIVQMEKDGTLRDDVKTVRKGMAQELEPLREKIEQQAEAFKKDETEFNAQVSEMGRNIEKAKAAGASDEQIEKMRKERDQKVEDFEAVKDQYGQTMLKYHSEHGNNEDFNKILKEALADNQHKNFKDLARDTIDSQIKNSFNAVAQNMQDTPAIDKTNPFEQNTKTPSPFGGGTPSSPNPFG